MRPLVIMFVAMLLGACATQVTSLKYDQDKPLANQQGYLLLGVQTNQNLHTIDISGPQDIELSSADIKKGTNYLLVDLPAGTYTINQVLFGHYRAVDLNDEEKWQFEVVPGQINYVGHLEVRLRGYWRVTHQIELVNSSSEALEFLLEKYPNLYSKRSLVYGGPGQDYFFESMVNDKGE